MRHVGASQRLKCCNLNHRAGPDPMPTPPPTPQNAKSQFASGVNNRAWLVLPHAQDSTEWSLGWVKRATERAVTVSPEMVAVTGRRIITADPQEFIQKGIVKEEFPINDVTPTFTDTDDALPELHLTQGEKKSREWCFPSAARVEARSIAEMLVDDPAQLLPPANPELANTQRDELEAADRGDPELAENPESVKNDESPDPGPEEAPTQPTA